MSQRWQGVLALLGAKPDQDTTDGRAIEKVRWNDDDAPWPLKLEHDGPVVGQINRVWTDGDLLRGEGTLHDESADEDTRNSVIRVIELLADDSGPVLGVSVELAEETVELRVDKEAYDKWLADMEAMMTGEEPEEVDPEVKEGRVVLETIAFDDHLQVITDSLFRGAALVPVAAFNEAKVALAASIALAASLTDVSAFRDPDFGPDGDHDPRLVWQAPSNQFESGGWGAPLTLLEDDTFYGHATLRFRCHGSFAACLPPPDEPAGFERFLIGDATGTGIPTGPIVLNTTHGVDGGKAKHDWLANTGMAVADAHVGWDTHGMWVAGKLRPGVTEREKAAFRGSALSGEWHPDPLSGKRRLVGILAVNAPGFLLARTKSPALAASITLGAQCCQGESTYDTRMDRLESLVASLIRRSL